MPIVDRISIHSQRDPLRLALRVRFNFTFWRYNPSGPSFRNYQLICGNVALLDTGRSNHNHACKAS